MENHELTELKTEIAQVTNRLDNVEGYFCNFDTTLNNHMNDYKAVQDDIRTEQKSIRKDMQEIALSVAKLQGAEGLLPLVIKWIVFPLIVILGGLAGVTVFLPGA